MPSPFPNAPQSIRGTTICHQLNSVALQGNYWNDPHIRDLWVHLPHGFDVHQAYPILIILPAFAGTGEGLLARSLTDVALTHRIDSWIAEERCPPCITIFPDVMTYLGGSQFLDSPAIGNYAQYITQDVISFVQEKYSVSQIAIMGHSSGGYGALKLAMENPDLFTAVACHAGDMGFSSAYSSDLLPALLAIHQAGSPKDFLSAFWNKRHFSGADFSAFNILCMSAAYAPNPNNEEFPADLPFDYHKGIIDFASFQTWEQHDPLHLMQKEANRTSLSALKKLYIECGSQDEYLLQFGSRRFVEQLSFYNIEHSYAEFEGGHRGGSLRFEHSIPQLIHACS